MAKIEVVVTMSVSATILTTYMVCFKCGIFAGQMYHGHCYVRLNDEKQNQPSVELWLAKHAEKRVRKREIQCVCVCVCVCVPVCV
jgi:hypothetical protein